MRVPLATELKTRQPATVGVLGTAVTGVRMTNNGTGYLPALAWAAKTLPAAPATDYWASIISVNGVFLVVSYKGLATARSADNGQTWTAGGALTASGTACVNPSIAWNGSLYCVRNGAWGVGALATTWTSADGVTWTEHSNAVAVAVISNTILSEIVAIAGIFHVANCLLLGPGKLYSSADGITWALKATWTMTLNAPGCGPWLVGNGAGGWLCTDRLNSGNYIYTTDGVTWLTAAGPIGPTTIAAYGGGGKFYTIDWTGGVIKTSPTGLTWTVAGAFPVPITTIDLNSSSGSGGNTGFWGMTYDANLGLWVANTGESTNSVWVSRDGVTWVAVVGAFPGPAAAEGAIASNGSVFVSLPRTVAGAVVEVSGPGTYPLSFSGGSGTGAVGTYAVNKSGNVVSQPAITAGGNYSILPSVAFPSGGGTGAAGTVLPVVETVYQSDKDARMLNAYAGPSSINKRPAAKLLAAIGAGEAQGGIAVGNRVFTLNGDIGLLT